MKIPFIKIFSIINTCLTADCVSDPIIEIQPRMNIKRITVKYDLCNGPVGNIPLTEWRPIRKYGPFIVELKFLVNYKNFLSYYTVDQRIVILKRYKKKQTQYEEYDELLHAPKYILLPEKNTNTTTFQIDIHSPDENDFGFSNNIDEKRSVVSFHSSSRTAAKDIINVAKLNEQLLTHLFEDDIDLSSSGFQFFFTIIAKNSDGEIVTKTLVSDFFGFDNSENESVLLTCVLDPNYFHISPSTHSIDEGRCSKLRKFFRRRNIFIKRCMCCIC